MEAKDLFNALEKNFPWQNMEKELSNTIFSDSFWNNVHKKLKMHKKENPGRCIEIIDSIGKYTNMRQYEDTTLAHYKNLYVAQTILPYLEEAVKQKCYMPISKFFILLCIRYEQRSLRIQVENILSKLSKDKVFVENIEKDKELVYWYNYLYRDYSEVENLLQKLDLL
ncbi:MAG: hypothetical protein E7012_04220 [Alphaproteobacteria bacterium]|nr:hypothetical protein [Alphaproteobacteria bacterium]